MSDPISIGGSFRRNVFSLSFNPTVALPAGALLFLAIGTDAPDTVVITITDGTENVYTQIVNSQQPGTPVTLFVFMVPKAWALSPANTITVTSSVRADFCLAGYYFPSNEGSLFSSDVQWANAPTLNYAVAAQGGMQLFALLGVAGPSNDGFTQDAAWGPDVPNNIPSTNFTVRACGRIATGGNGQYTWRPTLQASRQSVGFVCAFR